MSLARIWRGDFVIFEKPRDQANIHFLASARRKASNQASATTLEISGRSTVLVSRANFEDQPFWMNV
jgi:hypothetical protein